MDLKCARQKVTSCSFYLLLTPSKISDDTPSSSRKYEFFLVILTCDKHYFIGALSCFLYLTHCLSSLTFAVHINLLTAYVLFFCAKFKLIIGGFLHFQASNFMLISVDRAPVKCCYGNEDV